MKISVLIPTYRRPDDLRRCLDALTRQQRPADEVRVVIRNADEQTPAVLKEFAGSALPLAVSVVHEIGQVAALNVGLRDVIGDVFVITDDDAAPWPDWLARIEQVYLANPNVAGVGGRDWVYHGQELEAGAEQSVVGIVRWYGRVIGAHHLGVGGPRAVDVLKGVNSSYRTEWVRPIGFDRRLLGTGAQVHVELSIGMHLTRRLGKTLHFDPAIAVDHGRAKRHDEDQRDAFNALAVRNKVHNETLILLDYFSPVQRVVLMLWSFAMGTREGPGLLQVARLLARGDRHVFSQWLAAARGRVLALRAHHAAAHANTAEEPAGVPIVAG